MTAHAYVRESHRSSGVSTERQVAEIRAYCLRLGLGEPVFHVEQRSAVKHRPVWSSLEALVASGEVTCLVAYESSRLFRRARAWLTFLEDVVDRTGARLRFVYDDLDVTTADGRTMLGIKAMLDEAEQRRTSARNRRQRQRMVTDRRYAGLDVPFGWRLVEGGNLVPEPREQSALELMHALHAQGVGAKSIASALRDCGFRTKRGLDRWDGRTVWRILRSPACLFVYGAGQV